VTYRSLMVYLDPDHANEAALRVTADLANLFKSQVTGVAAGLPVMPVHADGMIATSILEVDYTQLEEALRRCEGRFRAAMMPVSDALQWRAAVASPAEFLADQARAADLIIVGRPADEAGPLLNQSLDIGDIVMAAGRPVLVVPPGRTSLTPDRIMVAWKDTVEARRTIAASLPLLKQAADVTVVEIVAADSDIAGATGRLADVAAWLQRHNVTAATRVELSAGHAGSHLDLLAEQNNVDILVAGAYGHSRLQEWVFGGVTRHLLRRASVCTLLMH
jgi:nucleotide-binding universal stress UspA family protein